MNDLVLRPPFAALMLAGAAALSGCGATASDAAEAARATGPAKGSLAAVGSPAAPVVVELFQSQGCSSCPPANANVNAIADQPGVLALSFSVTYWDQLGWKDSFATPAYTARQWDYARRAGRPQVATPQVIVNGGPTVVGSNRAQLDRLIAEQGPAHGGPALTATGDRVHVAAGHGPASTVWLVRYDPQVRAVPIAAGENGGRTLPHRDIVRQLVRLGSWSGGAVDFRVPASAEPNLAAAVLVQQGSGGPITAARKL